MSKDSVLANAFMSRDDAVTIFREVAQKLSQDQAIYFMNALWDTQIKDGKTAKDHAESIFVWHQEYAALCKELEVTGNMDEVVARKYLEVRGNTMTAMKFRASFKEVDIDNDKHMGFLEYLMFALSDASTEKLVELVKKPQATSPEMEAAKNGILEVQAALDAVAAARGLLVETAETGGVKGMAAKNQLIQFDQQDHVDIKMAEARSLKALERAQKTVKDAPGGLWWIARTAAEAEKYKPKKK